MKRVIVLLLTLSVLLSSMAGVVMASEEQKAESVAFPCHSKTGYIGFDEYLNVQFLPEGTKEKYTMTSSDESVVALDYNENSESYLASYLREGSAVVTVTTESGLVDQCTIHVMQMDAFALNETKTVTVQPGDIITYVFEYDTLGDYVLIAEENMYAKLNHTTKEVPPYEFSWGKRYFTLTEDSHFCRLRVWNDEDTAQTYTLHLMEGVPVQEIVISVDYTHYFQDTPVVPLYPGDSIWVSVEEYPVNAKREMYTWDVSDNSVGYLDTSGSSYQQKRKFTCTAPGTTQITVTTGNGVSSSVTVVVEEPQELQFGKSQEVVVPEGQCVRYLVTVQETDEYVFYLRDDVDIVGMSIETSGGGMVDTEYLYRAGNKTKYEFLTMEKGENYYISLYNYNADSELPVDYSGWLYFERPVPAEQIQLNYSQYSGEMWEYIELDVIFDPINAEIDSVEWYIDDESIAEFVDADPYWGALIRLLSPGKTTVTAKTRSGKTATCEITVKSYSEETEPTTPKIITSGWSGYTTWTLDDTGLLTVSPSDQTLNGKCNMRNYWKVDGVLTLPWSDYADQITTVVIEEGIHAIGQMAFYDLPNLQTVVLPESLEEIRNYAFKYDTALNAINLEAVDYIREGAFYGCTDLTEVTLGEDTVVESWAFSRVPGYAD